MVGNHPVMGLARPVGIGRRRMCAGLNQVAHQVRGIVVIRALQQRRHPFDPHPGIDRLVGQRLARTILELLVLHENEVPDLDETVTVFLGRSRRATPDVIAVIVENLGTGPAGASWASGPEVIIRRDPNDAFVRQASVRLPNFYRFFIRMVHRDQKPVRVDAELFRQQVPSEGDRLGLKVVAKAEIAQHLEKRVVPRGIAHVVKVIVLTARPHTFLRRRGAAVITCLHPGKKVLKLHHTSSGEHQCRVVARHQRAGGHDLMPLRIEIIQKS